MADGNEPDPESCRTVLLHLLRLNGNIDRVRRDHQTTDDDEACVVSAALAEATISDRLSTATSWIYAIDARDKEFGSELFYDPAWNILLDLYVHRQRNIPVSVSSLCIASKVPMTTALRWLTVLKDKGLIERRPDPRDHRRHFIGLSDAGLTMMERTLDAVNRGDRRLSARAAQILN